MLGQDEIYQDGCEDEVGQEYYSFEESVICEIYNVIYRKILLINIVDF